jgi:hypothetical protein
VFPFLSLADVHLDTDLAQRLPRRLAYYHLALPIAQDADGITVAMAHPEYSKVILVLEGALGARVIPVRSFAETIRQRLDDVWQREPLAQPVDTFDGLRVTHWARSADELLHSEGYLRYFLDALERETQVEISVMSEFLASSSTDLIVAAVGDALPNVLFHMQASLLVIRPDALPPRTILHVLRGHIPDYRVLDWLIPLSRQNVAEVTLLMSIDGYSKKPPMSDLSSILLAQDRRNTHITECRRRLSGANVAGRLKLRQGELLVAIRDELAERPYDLVAIAAEAYGDFAQQVSELVQESSPAFLVIKP